jgi:cytochrome P450
MVAAPSSAIHVDEEIYSNPETFDGFRFSGLHDDDGKVAKVRSLAVSTSPAHLAFGLGRRVW